MSPKDFRKICHPEAKILNSLVNCPQTLRQTLRGSLRRDQIQSGPHFKWGQLIIAHLRLSQSISLLLYFEIVMILQTPKVDLTCISNRGEQIYIQTQKPEFTKHCLCSNQCLMEKLVNGLHGGCAHFTHLYKCRCHLLFFIVEDSNKQHEFHMKM